MSDLCASSELRIFATTGKPIFFANVTASRSLLAKLSFGAPIPYILSSDFDSTSLNGFWRIAFGTIFKSAAFLFFSRPTAIDAGAVSRARAA
jgi:hypothetical protein